MNSPTFTTYSEGTTIPRGMEFVQYDLDDDGLATLTYEKRDGLMLRVHSVTRDERIPGRGDPGFKAWASNVLSKRPREEMQLDAMFLQRARAN